MGWQWADVPVHGAHWHDAIHPSSGQVAIADDGAQERADERDVERDQFQRGALSDPEGADEAAQSAPGLSVQAGAGYLHCPEDLRRRIGLCAAVALRLRHVDEQRHAQPGADADVPTGAEGGKDPRQVRAARPATHGKHASTRGGLYNTDWIEKCLAHEQRGVRAVYNKAEYREQRTAMLQDWADMIDG